MMDGRALFENDGMVSVKKMRDGGVFCQFFAFFIDIADHPSLSESYNYFRKMYGNFMGELIKNWDYIALARTAKEISEIRREGKIAAVFTIEEGAVLDGKPERLDEFYEMGIRLITLTWNHENCLGFPNKTDPEKGLKPFGFEAVKRMEELGIIVDVSHLSDGGFWDVAKTSKKPFIASHSNARSVCGHSRNMTDDMLKALADSGGVTGINFFFLFLGSGETGSVEQMVAHIKHIHKTAGIDTIAMGSDFDGFSGPCELTDCSRFPVLLDALGKAGYSDDEIEKICRKNAMRVIEAVM
jgi:membrane dipeptidase